MTWVWTEEKNRTNKRDHALSFETAQRVFDDPPALSRPDLRADGDRWQTVGRVGRVILLVVHTGPEFELDAGEERGRIISARKATSRERRAHEQEDF